MTSGADRGTPDLHCARTPQDHCGGLVGNPLERGQEKQAADPDIAWCAMATSALEISAGGNRLLENLRFCRGVACHLKSLHETFWLPRTRGRSFRPLFV